MSLKKVAVIGAGVFGLAAVRYLSAEPGIEVVCFEKRQMTGGLWNYEESPDKQPHLSPIYRDLRGNNPILLCEFPDKPMQTSCQWPGQKDIAAYVHSYTEELGLDQFIRFNTEVLNIKKLPQTDTDVFVVESRPLSGGQATEETFDSVVVAVGYCGKPLMPDIPGEELFGGDILHSWRYRKPEIYANKKVFLVGSNISSWDIAWDLSSHVSELVVSHHEETLLMTLPENGQAIRSGVKEFTQTGVILENGEAVICDAVIYCTGYFPIFPFFDETCQTTVTLGRVENLYKMIAHTKVSSLYFIGMYNYTALMKVAACQAMFIASAVTGRVKLPSSEDMQKEVDNEFKEHIATGQPPRTFHYLIYNSRKYCKSLEAMGGFENLPNVVHSIMERVFDIVFKERGYIKMRNLHFEAVDSDNFTERSSTK